MFLQGRSKKRRLLLRGAVCACIALAAAWGARGQATQAATAPTASESPAEIDRVWQKASSKYDGARQKMLATVQHTVNAGPYRPDWESLRAYVTPDWYKDAKFGIFIHWGVYSVPAFGSEWYPRNMYQRQEKEFKHHVDTYGPQSKFGYKDFIPMFRAEKFNPQQWVELFKKAGARYVVPVAEHHDGFAMYKTTLSKWNAYEMGPKRDVLGELSA